MLHHHQCPSEWARWRLNGIIIIICTVYQLSFPLKSSRHQFVTKHVYPLSIVIVFFFFLHSIYHQCDYSNTTNDNWIQFIFSFFLFRIKRFAMPKNSVSCYTIFWCAMPVKPRDVTDSKVWSEKKKTDSISQNLQMPKWEPVSAIRAIECECRCGNIFVMHSPCCCGRQSPSHMPRAIQTVFIYKNDGRNRINCILDFFDGEIHS